MELLKSEKPDLMWVSLPCGPTSFTQNLNMLLEEGRQSIEKKVLKSKPGRARSHCHKNSKWLRTELSSKNGHGTISRGTSGPLGQPSQL